MCPIEKNSPVHNPILNIIFPINYDILSRMGGGGGVQGGLRPGKVVEDSLSAFVTVCDSSEAEVLR